MRNPLSEIGRWCLRSGQVAGEALILGGSGAAALVGPGAWPSAIEHGC